MSLYEKFQSICRNQDHYPTQSELIYKFGFSVDSLKDISQKKILDEEYIKLPLQSPFGHPLFYWNQSGITMHFFGSQDLIRNSDLNQFSDFRNSEMLNGFVFSEIESSLAIEGVRSTRAQIEKLNRTEYNDIHELNDIIVKNMLLGYEFVKKHEITEENIFELYSILSKRCLKDNEQLLPGVYYRHDDVHIVDGVNAIVDKGVDAEHLPKLMSDLIRFMNQEKTSEEHLIASHIIHYYLVYLHPYFDYNGRMARVLSFWYNFRHAPSLSLLLVSEAINHKFHKKDYYNAIMNSRNSGNDITFFLEYMGKIILKYSKIYINFYSLKSQLKGKGRFINRSIEIALKYVLAMPVIGDGFFDWRDFKEFSHDEFSKQYYLKLLNALVSLEILTVREYKKAYLYKLNGDYWDLLV